MAPSKAETPRETIHVELGARSYDILIRRGLLKDIGAELTRLRCVGKVGVVTDGCLECGTCRVVCAPKNVAWDYPRGGFGILFKFG